MGLKAMNIGYFFIFIAVLDFKADDILKAGKSSHLRGVREGSDLRLTHVRYVSMGVSP
jgi:hypothetical protein